MIQEMLVGLVILFILLVAGVYILLAVKGLRQAEKDRAELLLRIRTRLVNYLNDQLFLNSFIDKKNLCEHIEKLNDLYDLIAFDINIEDDGKFIISLDWGKHKTKVEGVLSPLVQESIDDFPYMIK